jgi:hypothetical protein
MKFVLFFILFPILSFSQTNEGRLYSVKVGFGLGFHEGKKENGLGFLVSVGFQKKAQVNNRLRINSNFNYGRFNSDLIRDIPSQEYSFYSLDFLFLYDLLKYKAFSMVTQAGGSVNVTSGKISRFFTEDGIIYPENEFTYFYFVGSASLGLRIAPKSSKIAVDLMPINIFFAKNSIYGGMKISVDYKINK